MQSTFKMLNNLSYLCNSFWIWMLSIFKIFIKPFLPLSIFKMLIKLCNRFLDFDAVDIQIVDQTIFTYVLDFWNWCCQYAKCWSICILPCEKIVDFDAVNIQILINSLDTLHKDCGFWYFENSKCWSLNFKTLLDT